MKINNADEIFRKVEEMDKIREELFKDIEYSNLIAQHKKEESDQIVVRRMKIRGMFAVVEAILYLNKELCAEIYKNEGDIDQDLMLKFKEKKMHKKTGEERSSFLNMEDNIDFVCKEFPLLCGSSYKIEMSGENWDDFMESVGIRNLLAHPKGVSSIQITEENINL